MNQLRLTNLPYQQVRYLKHVGALNNVKVTAQIRDGVVCLYIQDFEFTSFESALRFLQEDSRMIAHKSQDLEVVS